jgi:type VI secretion system protein ImpE
MSSLAALRNADLSKAWEELKNDVRREPAVAKHRVFMFQLACVLGDWDRALTQLNVARDMDPQCLQMAQTYQELIQCEALRKKIFAGERSPLFFGEPEPWMVHILEATKLGGKGKHAEAAKLRGEALENAATSSGGLRLRKDEPAEAGDEPPAERFEWIADADPRLGPMLEGIVNGRYYWIPFSRIRRVDFEKPTDLRDVVWLPTHYEWTNGGEAVGFTPVRYPDSETSTDDLIRLARKTEWRQVADEIFLGSGQRVLTTDQNEYSLFDLRQIVIDEPPPAA